MSVDLRRFDSPDETRRFEKGRYDVIHLGGMTLGRASYEPGWKWSEHVGPTSGTKTCEVDHLGLVLSGRVAVKMNDGRLIELSAGDAFAIGPGHDSWVVGEEPYVALHFQGAVEYAKKA